MFVEIRKASQFRKLSFPCKRRLSFKADHSAPAVLAVVEESPDKLA